MLFNSIEFAIFLPIVFLLYWFVLAKSYRVQNAFIVVASYLFYGWWDWRFLILIAFTTACSWGSGLLIERYRDKGKRAKWFCVSNIVINLAILGLFKYYDFFATAFADAFLGGDTDGLLLNIILPVGISFYTFQALSYTIDVYRGKLAPTKDAICFFAFVSFFPQLVAGPIERATNLLPQFSKPRTFDYRQAVDGLRQILWGLFLKVVIADNCALFVDKIFDNYQNCSGSTLLVGAVLFSFQIYGDFAGYSEIAIGTAKLFGIKLMRNFNLPYLSRDIAEFWRRWHISLTTWFRDYVYIPLGGSRCSKAKIVRNTFVIFLLSGFWHGANWTFIIWGAYHALLFLPLILLGKNRKHKDIVAADRFLPTFKEALQIIGTFILATLGWIIFRAETFSDAVGYVSRIFSSSLFTSPDVGGMNGLFVAIVVLIVIEWLQRKRPFTLDINNVRHAPVRYAIYASLLLLLFFFGGNAVNFIYFQF